MSVNGGRYSAANESLFPSALGVALADVWDRKFASSWKFRNASTEVGWFELCATRCALENMQP
jgi:hypothetical protein